MRRLLALLLSEIAVLVADVAGKNWATRGGQGWLALSVVGYTVVSAAWLVVLKSCQGDLATATAYWVASGGVTTILLGLLVYREQLSIFGVIGLILIISGAILVTKR